MRNAFKWRLTNTAYVYITGKGETFHVEPYILTTSEPDFKEQEKELDSKVPPIVSTWNKDEYKTYFENMVTEVRKHPEYDKAEFLDWNKYFNINSESCIEEDKIIQYHWDAEHPTVLCVKTDSQDEYECRDLGLYFDWDETKLGVRRGTDEDSDYDYSDLGLYPSFNGDILIISGATAVAESPELGVEADVESDSDCVIFKVKGKTEPDWHETRIEVQKGAQGPKGDTGHQGPQGAKGDKGDPGSGGEGVWEHGEGEDSVQIKRIGTQGPAKAIGNYSTAEGAGTQAKGDYSHAEGFYSWVVPNSAYGDWADGYAAHAEGYNTSAAGRCSHTEGDNTVTNNAAEHAEGRYNISHCTAHGSFENSGNTIHSIGIGKPSPDGSFENNKNAFEIMHSGDAYLIGVGNYQGKEIKTEDNGIKTLQEVINNAGSSIPVMTGVDEDINYSIILRCQNETSTEFKTANVANEVFVSNMGGQISLHSENIECESITAEEIHANAYYENSDIRKKNIISEVSDIDVKRLLDLSLVYFTYKEDKSRTKQIGVIAQEIQKICPEIVSEGRDGYLVVDYSKLSVICLYCIKDIYRRIQTCV